MRLLVIALAIFSTSAAADDAACPSLSSRFNERAGAGDLRAASELVRVMCSICSRECSAARSKLSALEAASQRSNNDPRQRNEMLGQQPTRASVEASLRPPPTPLKSLEIRQRLDANDFAGLIALLSVDLHGPIVQWIQIDGGKPIQAYDLRIDVSQLQEYLSARDECTTLDGSERAAEPNCMAVAMRLLDRVDFQKCCGMEYGRIALLRAEHQTLVENYAKREARVEAREVLEGARRERAWQWLRSDPRYQRAGIATELCSNYRHRDSLQSLQIQMKRVDARSGTVNLQEQRRNASAQIFIEDKISSLEKQYTATGAKLPKSDALKFACSQPEQSSIEAEYAVLINPTDTQNLLKRAGYELQFAEGNYDPFFGSLAELAVDLSSPAVAEGYKGLLVAAMTRLASSSETDLFVSVYRRAAAANLPVKTLDKFRALHVKILRKRGATGDEIKDLEVLLSDLPATLAPEPTGAAP